MNKMQGPYPPEALTSPAPASPESWEGRHGLVRGEAYRVVRAFQDADGDLHPVGEQWSFICATFSKFDDEIQIAICRKDGTGWRVPLVWKPEKQADIIEHVESYLKAK